MPIIKGNWAREVTGHSPTIAKFSKASNRTGYKFVSKYGKDTYNGDPSIDTDLNEGPLRSPDFDGSLKVIGSGYYQITSSPQGIIPDGLVVLDGQGTLNLVNKPYAVPLNNESILILYNINEVELPFSIFNQGLMFVDVQNIYGTARNNQRKGFNCVYIRCGFNVGQTDIYDNCIFIDCIVFSSNTYNNCLFINCNNISAQASTDNHFFNCTFDTGFDVDNIGSDNRILSINPMPGYNFFDFNVDSSTPDGLAVFNSLKNTSWVDESLNSIKLYDGDTNDPNVSKFLAAINANSDIQLTTNSELDIISGDSFLQIGTEQNPLSFGGLSYFGKFKSLGILNFLNLDVLRVPNALAINPAHLTFELKWRVKDSQDWNTRQWWPFRYDMEVQAIFLNQFDPESTNGQPNFNWDGLTRRVAVKDFMIRIHLQEEFTEQNPF